MRLTVSNTALYPGAEGETGRLGVIPHVDAIEITDDRRCIDHVSHDQRIQTIHPRQHNRWLRCHKRSFVDVVSGLISRANNDEIKIGRAHV